MIEPYYQEENITIYCGDCLEVMKELPDESIDMIITDPPYVTDSIYVYENLAKEANRILKDGSFCFAYVGTEFLPQIFKYMNDYLNWFFLFGILHKGPQPRFWSKKIMVGFKPIFCFTKGKPKKLGWINNIHSDRADKRYHIWGQGKGFTQKVLEVLSEPNYLILDPFLGSGTTARACKDLGRKCIGIEIKQAYCDIAIKRLGQEVLNFKTGD